MYCNSWVFLTENHLILTYILKNTYEVNYGHLFFITFINVLFNTPNMTNFNHDEDLINQQ